MIVLPDRVRAGDSPEQRLVIRQAKGFARDQGLDNRVLGPSMLERPSLWPALLTPTATIGMWFERKGPTASTPGQHAVRSSSTRPARPATAPRTSVRAAQTGVITARDRISANIIYWSSAPTGFEDDEPWTWVGGRAILWLRDRGSSAALAPCQQSRPRRQILLAHWSGGTGRAPTDFSEDP